MPKDPFFAMVSNDKPWEHRSHYGTRFTNKRCDFREPMQVFCPPDQPRDHLASDVAEMIGFHATNIWPGLNGFAGYDCIRWEFHEE